jgi:hypothetical protein
MNKVVLNSSERLYSIFLKFYPKNYRQEFGEEMKYVYSESLKDAYRESGLQGVITFWTRSAIDGVKSFFIQHIESQKGGDSMKTKNKDLLQQNKVFLWVALGVALILAIPLLMRWPWTLSDFVVMGTLIFGMGSLFVFTARKFSNHRLLVALAVAAAFLLIWVHLAVGIVDTWPFAGS